MAELMKAFFERDLSPAEEAQLKRLIEESSEAAMDFAKVAAADYKAAGLAKPLGRGMPWKLAAWVGLPLLLVAASYSAFEMGRRQPPPPVVPQRVGPLKPEARVAAKSAPAPKAQAVKKAPIQPRPQAAQPSVAPPPDQLVVRPAGIGFDLLLTTAQAGSTRVVVMDRSGSVIKRLYDGRVDAGRWRFQWDGKDSAGLKAGPGIYRIEVRRPGEIVRRLVEIEQH